MKDLSIAMALMDFLPVVLFTVAVIMLQRDLYNKMSKGAFALFAMGTLDIVFAGVAKAVYKLLYASGVCDFQPLSNMFFPVQSIGFLMAGIAVVAMISFRQGNTLYSAAPPVFMGTFVFVGCMCLGLGMFYVVLCRLAVMLKRKSLILVFLLSFICSLVMGYMSSKDFSLAYINWIAQGINTIGQALLLYGAVTLRRAGLVDLIIRKKVRNRNVRAERIVENC